MLGNYHPWSNILTLPICNNQPAFSAGSIHKNILLIMTINTLPLRHKKLLHELAKLSKYGRFKPPSSLTELILLLLKICQFNLSLQIGIGLVQASSRELFITALGFLLLLSISISGLIFYLWTYQREKLSAFTSTIFMSKISPHYVFVILGVTAFTLVECFGGATRLVKVFLTIIKLNMINVQFIGYSIPLASFEQIYQSIIYLSLSGILIGILVALAGLA